MILRLSSKQLRQLADQVDALTAMQRAGAPHVSSHTPIVVDGQALAYVAWWEDQECYLAEFISFVPGNAQPLSYHDESDKVASR